MTVFLYMVNKNIDTVNEVKYVAYIYLQRQRSFNETFEIIIVKSAMV